MNRHRAVRALGVSAPLCATTVSADSQASGFFVEPAPHFALIGDTPYAAYQLAQVDKPLTAPTSDPNIASGARRLEGFTRVETFGDGEVHWSEVVVDPKTPEVFRFHARIVEANKYVR